VTVCGEGRGHDESARLERNDSGDVWWRTPGRSAWVDAACNVAPLRRPARCPGASAAPDCAAGCGISSVRLALAVAAGALAALLPAMVSAWCYRQGMAHPLTAAQAHLGELVAETRQSHRPVTISEHGQPVAALISIDDLADLADLEDRAALAAHLTDKATRRDGISLDGLDAALDRIDAETLT
jgi:prevent-host-death family protein